MDAPSLLRYIRERLAEFCSPEQEALVVTLNLQAKRFHTPDGLIEGLRRDIERQIARSHSVTGIGISPRLAKAMGLRACPDGGSKRNPSS